MEDQENDLKRKDLDTYKLKVPDDKTRHLQGEDTKG